MAREVRAGRAQNKFIDTNPVDDEESVSKRRKLASSSDLVDDDESLDEEAADQSGIEQLSDKVRFSAAQSLRDVIIKLVTRAVEAGPDNGGIAETPIEPLSELLALHLEAAIYNNFAVKPKSSSKVVKPVDVGQRYREKFRTLNFNLRDDKNQVFQHQVVTEQMTPDEIVNLTPEQMMSPELRKLRDEVHKESIRESVLKVDEPPRVRRTHKGEEFVERDDDHPEEDLEEDLNTLGGPIPSVQVRGSLDPSEMTADDRENDNPNKLNPTGSYYRTDFGVSYSPQASDSDFDEGQEKIETADDSADSLSSVPIWEGKLSIDGDHESFIGTGFALTGPNDPQSWAAILSPTQDLNVTGKSDDSEVSEYLAKIRDSATLGVVAFISDNSQAITEIRDYLAARSAVGVFNTASNLLSDIVKDSFLAVGSDIEKVLNLDTRAEKRLANLKKDNLVLYGIYVLPRDI